MAIHANTKLVMRRGASLPHWTMDGAIYAVTFRLADSLPGTVLRELREQRNELVRSTGGRNLSAAEEQRLRSRSAMKIEASLDLGIGQCRMSSDIIARLIADAIQKFDSDRYRLFAWCVMPNHVHAVIQPLARNELPQILHSWKSFTASSANRLLNRGGPFWQVEYYDHLIRDEDDLNHAVEYVLSNPAKAGLCDWKLVGTGKDSVLLSGPA